MNYFQKLRHDFITKFIEKNGYINRSDIVDEFSVSIPLASKDISVWMKKNPNKISYNKRLKRYEVS